MRTAHLKGVQSTKLSLLITERRHQGHPPMTCTSTCSNSFDSTDDAISEGGMYWSPKSNS
jgi:hypothetical protein